MSALDTVKELGRMATTATLTKDVIDLFNQKVELLEKQVATLEQENTALKTQNSNLKAKLYDLEQELTRLKPKDDLDTQALQFLQILARQSGLRIEQIAGYLRVSKVRAEYHRDKLKGAGLIGYHGGVVVIGAEEYELRSKGREYLAAHGHI